MSPLTHLLASWLVAAKTTNNPRDCRLATLAGLLPDADGLGLVVGVFNRRADLAVVKVFRRWAAAWQKRGEG